MLEFAPPQSPPLGGKLKFSGRWERSSDPPPAGELEGGEIQPLKSTLDQPKRSNHA